jgi:hypothetical protein
MTLALIVILFQIIVIAKQQLKITELSVTLRRFTYFNENT